MKMSIPPFPSQDLAKLVLGYLAEEQLMTAYDEFLQASPYLDALRNEYDRIFMTSLKSILAEYRAVKIYVDTCKPFLLRKKIFQCSNLLDVVKFLVTNVDINKIQLQEATEKASLEKLNITITPKPNICEVCSSKHASCVCKVKQTDVQQHENISASNVEASSLQNSVETTPLSDLPGNHVTTRKKHMKVLEKDCVQLPPNVTSIQNSDSSAKQSFSSIISPEEYLASCEESTVLRSSDSNSRLSLNSTVKAIDPSKSKQSIEEFNNVLKSVVNRNKTLSGSECPPNQRISNASTFQEFVSGVSSGESKSATYNLPDSSTSENLNFRTPIIKDLYNHNTKGPPQCQLMLQVSHVNDNIEIQTCRGEAPTVLKPPQPAKLPKLQPKVIGKQIKIISDVKVGSQYSDKNKDNVRNKPLLPINATSTPLMQMHTITINGVPAYKHNTPKFTKDEIMAMPTLIVVPASGSSQIPTSAHCESIVTQNSHVMSQMSSTSVLEPLVIDVPPNTALPNKPIVMALPDLSEHKHLGSDLVKTVDVRNASVPKDNVISMETNTPQVLPPTRKSSSTPRRSSHIRVLDFTTPRRILQETINEQVPNQSSDPPVEVILSSSPNIASTQTTSENVIAKTDVTVVNEEANNNDSGSAKENDDVKKSANLKKYDWDADLRALVANDKTVLRAPDSVTKRKSRPKTSKKTKPDIITDSDNNENKKITRSKKSSRVKKKIRREIEDDEPPPNLDRNNDIPWKPTINIICGKNNENIDLQVIKNDTESIKNKSLDKYEEYIETPEAERLSLQNVIGAKLNISDLLETPYKQALYDIQMETPKFLGPDLPGEPLSDIKIMNIPTPRFLNDTPKPVEATPSSYSSRPTDYSSGGSYYKPDDQDYMPYPDLIACPVTSSKEDLSIKKSTEKDGDKKKARPKRQCTKNVSYYKNSNLTNKTKDVEDNVEAASCSDNISINSSFEFQDKKEVIPTTPLDKALIKTETKKRNSTCRKRKSPKDFSIRDKTKSFMKIKPRYTPKKTPSGRNRNKHMPSQHYRVTPSLQERKRTTSKEKLANATPAVVAVSTKSRRKSSTPRKLHCTKTFNSESSGHDSPEATSNTKPNSNREKTAQEFKSTTFKNAQDSDTEQIALRWSDDGSQDKTKDIPPTKAGNEIEDITKIKEFIYLSDVAKRVRPNTDSAQENLSKQRIEADGTLQRDLMKRGFDLETAKIIERDLLDETPVSTEPTTNKMLPIPVENIETKKDDSALEKTLEIDNNITNELEIVQDETDDDDGVLSVQECNGESKNFFVFEHDDTKEIPQGPAMKLKQDYTMEFCFSDVSNVRLKLTPFISIADEKPATVDCVDEIDYSYKETERAVSSISNIDRLYTPLKDSINAQCYEIFDSTLTSIDTPLKKESPPRTPENTAQELVLGEKDAKGAKKRKRLKNADEQSTSNKRTKPDADLLLKTANIQNIDIETVLTKLHGH